MAWVVDGHADLTAAAGSSVHLQRAAEGENTVHEATEAESGADRAVQHRGLEADAAVPHDKLQRQPALPHPKATPRAPRNA
jgi:hypothetical protein